MRRLRIGFLTAADARRRSTWSGIPFYMADALQRNCGDVVFLGPLYSWVARAGAVRDRVQRRLTGRGFSYGHSRMLSRDYARMIRKRLGSDIDVIFAPVASTELAHLHVPVPIVYTSDATVELLFRYYPQFRDVGDEYRAAASETERRALANASCVVYPSEWAAASARRDYGIPDDKVFVIPYGANLEVVPSAAQAASAKSRDTCLLTLLGVEWERKGGPIAFEAVRELRELGVDARLVVCGCVPPPEFRADWLTVIPRLDKEDEAQRAQLSDLLAASNFLILPSRQEAFGIVFCEASAHGTPSIAADTGGVSSAVTQGRNGFLLPPDASPREYALKIAALFRDEEGYRSLVASSRQAYDETLNWDAWARAVGEHMRRLVS